MTRKERCAKFKPAYEALMKYYPLTIEDLDGEIWRDILHYEGLYRISNWGRVKSFQRKEPRIMTPAFKGGYLFVRLFKDGKGKMFFVHCLVAQAFIPNPENKPEVDHRYGVHFDNSVWNLSRATRSENRKYAYETGVQKALCGEEHQNAKLTNEQVQYIRENPDDLTQRQLAEKNGVVQMTISDIQLGKIWRSAGGVIHESKFKRIPEEIRIEIRRLYKPRDKEFGARALARKFGVEHSTILNIIKEGN